MATISATAASPVPPQNSSWVVDWFAGLVLPVALLGAWQVAAMVWTLPRFLVAPSAILGTLWSMTVSGEIFFHAGESLFRSAIGFLIGASCGAVAGLAAGVLPRVERFYDPLISLTYPLPKIAFLPIIFAWLGIGDASKIAVIATSVFFPVYIGAYYGAKSTSRIHVWSGQNAGAGRWRIFFCVVIPSALPQLLNGARVGIAMSFIVMVTCELVTASKGLGFLIGRAASSLRFDLMYVAMIGIAALGFTADRLLMRLRRRLLSGQVIGKEESLD